MFVRNSKNFYAALYRQEVPLKTSQAEEQLCQQDSCADSELNMSQQPSLAADNQEHTVLYHQDQSK